MWLTLYSTTKGDHCQLNVQIDFYYYFQNLCFILMIGEIFVSFSFKFNSLNGSYWTFLKRSLYSFWLRYYTKTWQMIPSVLGITWWIIPFTFHLLCIYFRSYDNTKRLISYILTSRVLLNHFRCSINFIIWLTNQTSLFGLARSRSFVVLGSSDVNVSYCNIDNYLFWMLHSVKSVQIRSFWTTPNTP